MRYVDLDQIREIVGDAVKGSTIAGKVYGFSVDLGDSGSPDEFIRVLIQVKNTVELSDQEVDDATSHVEDAVSQRDDRFPSVRFSER